MLIKSNDIVCICFDLIKLRWSASCVTDKSVSSFHRYGNWFLHQCDTIKNSRDASAIFTIVYKSNQFEDALVYKLLFLQVMCSVTQRLWDNEDGRRWEHDVDDATLRTDDFVEDRRLWGRKTLRTDDFEDEDRYYEVILRPNILSSKSHQNATLRTKFTKLTKFADIFKNIKKYGIYDANTWGMNVFIWYMLLTFGESM